MAKTNDPTSIYGIFLFALAFISLISIATMGPFSVFSSVLWLSYLLSIAIFSAYLLAFLGMKESKHKESALKTVFVLGIVNFSAALLFSGHIIGFVYLSTSNLLFFIALYSLILIGLFLGSVIFPSRKLYKDLAIIIGALLLVTYFYPSYGFLYRNISDEIFAGFLETGVFLHGMNPYTTTVASLLYSNLTKGNIQMLTLPTNNQVIGTLSYPLGYILADLPFYLLSTPTPQDFNTIDFNIQFAVFMLVLFAAILYSIDKRYRKSAPYTILLAVFVAFVVFTIDSPQVFLALALLVLAYAKLESKYSWLLMGLTLCIQQIFWLPVIMLVIYSFSNSGLKRGLYNLSGAVLVFLAVNSYFIITSPAAFLNGVLSTIGPIPPQFLTITPATNYLITGAYGLPLNAGSALFGLASLLSILLFAYSNNKKLIGLFSMFPFIFFFHAIWTYFTLFILLSCMVLFVKPDVKRDYGAVGGLLRKQRPATFLLIFAILLGMGWTVYYYHLMYSRSFDLMLDSQRLYVNRSNGEEVYTAALHYQNLYNDTLYLQLYTVNTAGITKFSSDRVPLISNPSSCVSMNYTCVRNRNEIHLNANNSTYNITLYINPYIYGAIYNATLEVYNGEYVYVGSIVPLQNSLQSSQNSSLHAYANTGCPCLTKQEAGAILNDSEAEIRDARYTNYTTNISETPLSSYVYLLGSVQKTWVSSYETSNDSGLITQITYLTDTPASLYNFSLLSGSVSYNQSAEAGGTANGLTYSYTKENISDALGSNTTAISYVLYGHKDDYSIVVAITSKKEPPSISQIAYELSLTV